MTPEILSLMTKSILELEGLWKCWSTVLSPIQAEFAELAQTMLGFSC